MRDLILIALGLYVYQQAKASGNTFAAQGLADLQSLIRKVNPPVAVQTYLPSPGATPAVAAMPLGGSQPATAQQQQQNSTFYPGTTTVGWWN